MTVDIEALRKAADVAGEAMFRKRGRWDHGDTMDLVKAAEFAVAALIELGWTPPEKP